MTQAAGLGVEVLDSRIREFTWQELDQVPSTGWARLPSGGVLLRADPAGTRPLCWRRVGNAVYLGCYPGTLARIPPASPPDFKTLQTITRGRFPDDGSSAFADIRRVVAGSGTTLGPEGRCSEERWWGLPRVTRIPTPDDLWRGLVVACGRIIAGRRVAVLLSGGLDSSTVAAAAVAAARANGWPTPLLVSLAYPGIACDETEWQVAVAAHLGAPRLALTPDRAGVWSGARACIHRRLTPIVDIQSGRIGDLFQAADREGCRAILTGFGGDVLFRGIGLESGLSRRGRLAAVQRHFRGLAEAMPVSVPRLWYRNVFRPLLSGRWAAGLSPAEVAAAGGGVRSVVGTVLADPGFGWLMEALEQSTPGPAATLEHPFYDPEFLGVYAGLRDDDFARSRSHKGILREVARAHLPGPVVERRRKTNFHHYHRVWLTLERGDLVARYRDLRPLAPPGFDLPDDISGQLEITTGPSGFSTSWLILGVLEFLSAMNGTESPTV